MASLLIASSTPAATYDYVGAPSAAIIAPVGASTLSR